MSVIAPPPHDELELLIREARARQRRRRLFVAGLAAAASAGALAVLALVPSGGAGPLTSGGSRGSLTGARHCPSGNLGTIAFVRAGALDLLNLNGCRARTLVRSHVTGRVGMSADGRWVSFWRGYVSARGGRVHRIPGYAAWSPRGDLLAVITSKGGVEMGRAGSSLHRLLPDGWGASTLVFASDGRRLAVSRTAERGHIEAIWLVDLSSGSRRVLFREPGQEGAPPLLEGFSPDGRWLLFWQDLYGSASMLADGVPLLAVPVAGGRPRLVNRELYYDDYVSWCGGRLTFVLDRGGRSVTLGDGLAQSSPPGWGATRTLLPSRGPVSWGAFSCGPDGALAVAAGPSNGDEPFGHEHRSLWLVRGKTPRRLAASTPARGASDEWPSWSADGRWLLFVRTRWNGHGWPGSLYALRLATGKLVGPIAKVGETENYYGHYGWASQLAWHRP